MYIKRVTSRNRKNRFVSRCEGGVAGEGRVVGVPKLHSWDKHHGINEYQLKLDVQRFLWPVY